MRRIESIISSYLCKRTQYAILLSGSWGTGKTHLFKSEIAKGAATITTIENAGKNYKPIYVSLFGLRTIEDVATKIVAEFYQSNYFDKYFKKDGSKRVLKISQSILRIGLRGFMNFFNLGSSNEYVTDLREIAKNVLDTSELFICFDDIERKHSDLSFEDFAGYINSLVDEKVKVMIIANEDILSNSPGYSDIKEKIIGITVPYIPETSRVCDSIIEKNYAGFPVFQNFLKHNSSLLVELASCVNDNFRYVSYSLDVLHDIHSAVTNKLIDTKKPHFEKLEAHWDFLIRIIFAYSSEFKASRLSYSQKASYEKRSLTMADILGSDGSESLTDIESFLQKFKIQKYQYQYFESIFGFATVYSEFDPEAFYNEFIRNYQLVRVSAEVEVINRLAYPVCFDLSDEDYKTLTSTLISNAKAGAYADPSDYLTIMHYVERFDNFLKFDLDTIAAQIVAGLKKAVDASSPAYHTSSNMFELQVSGKMSAHVKTVFDEGLRYLQEQELKKDNTKAHDTGLLLFINPRKFQNHFGTDNSFRQFVSYEPILSNLSPAELKIPLQKVSNNGLFYIRSFLLDRFVDAAQLASEQYVLMAIVHLLEEQKSELMLAQNNQLRAYVIEQVLIPLKAAFDQASIALT